MKPLFYALLEIILEIGRIAAPQRLRRRFRDVVRVRQQYQMYRSAARQQRTLCPRWRDRYLITNEASSSVNYEPHYTYHLSWACRLLARCPPSTHVDIGSSMQFVGMASAWLPISHYDVRQPAISLPSLHVGTASLTSLPFDDESIESLSCMHVIEHIGLGRYGDPIDNRGDHRAAAELARVVAPGGKLLMVVPVGRPRIAFNAHRIYCLRQVLELFPTLKLTHSALLPDGGAPSGLVEAPTAELVDRQKWGCGCFVFEKPATD